MITSFLNQTYKNIEIIIADGGSTDDTFSIIEKYQIENQDVEIRVYHNPNEKTVVDSYWLAIDNARGDYIIQGCTSDGLLSPNWIEICCNILNSRNDIALVWGLPQHMSEDGRLLRVGYPDFELSPPRSDYDFFPFWVAYHSFALPELNYVLRKNVYIECFPSSNGSEFDLTVSHVSFMRRFVERGYLPYFVDMVANWGRTHEGQRQVVFSDVETKFWMQYRRWSISFFLEVVLLGKEYVFRDGFGKKIRLLSVSERFRYILIFVYESLLRSRPFQLPLAVVIQKSMLRLIRAVTRIVNSIR